jgi:hypothetical protein
LLKNQFFGIYFILEKVWKIIHDNDKDLNTKDLRFTEFRNYFLKEKSVDYVHGPFIKYQPFNCGWTAEIRTMKGYARD